MRGLLNEKENLAASMFAHEHYKKHRKTAALTLTAEQTGLGYSIKVQCPHCRKTKDISDYESW